MAKKKVSPNEDLEDVLLNASGRRFVWRLIEESGAFGDPYVKGDPMATARETGRKSMGVGLYAEVMTNHFELFQIMLREQNQELEDTKKAVDNGKESE